jgi:hypothetical protein
LGRIYLVGDKAELDHRRPLVGRTAVVEIWQDLHAGDVGWLGSDETRRRLYQEPRATPGAGRYWLGEASRQALDAVGAPLPWLVAVDETAVPVYYGPRLAQLESLPSEESLRARVVSGHGIGVACVSYDQLGARNEAEPRDPTDPMFLLRRVGGRIAHRWRLFRSRREAVVYMAEYYGKDPEAQEWAAALPAADFAELLARFGQTP